MCLSDSNVLLTSLPVKMFSLRERQSKVPRLALQCEWFLMSGCLYSDLCFSLWFNQWTNALHFSVLSVSVGFHLFLLVFDWSFGPSKSLKAANHWESNEGLVDCHKHIYTEKEKTHVWALVFAAARGYISVLLLQ